MRPWMMALIVAVKRKLTTLGPYTASRTFIAPLTTSKIETITGKGANGTPSTSQSGYFYTERAESQGRLRGTSTWVVLGTATSSGFSTSIPTDRCGPAVSSTNSTYDAYRSCYYYSNVRAGTNVTPATTGASTTAFSKTFPGGVGGPATPVTFTDVPVSGGSSYPLNIPTGGEITTFSYYE